LHTITRGTLIAIGESLVTDQLELPLDRRRQRKPQLKLPPPATPSLWAQSWSWALGHRERLVAKIHDKLVEVVIGLLLTTVAGYLGLDALTSRSKPMPPVIEKGWQTTVKKGQS
jgi:hypothetical protein